MSALVTRRDSTTIRAARGISISKLERRALDDPMLRAGCMLMDPYVCCDPCWNGWLCARIMEHLRGERYWEELDHGDYGALEERWHGSPELVETLVARAVAGAETVELLIWAVETGLPLDSVVRILRTLTVGTRRVARFPWLSETAPCGRA